jgi:hypothetical protein
MSAYMITACTLFHMLVFIGLSLLRPLLITSAITILLDLIYMQIWLVGIIPTVLKTSRTRTFLLGNLAFLIVQTGGFLLVNWYFHLNAL